MSDNRTKIRPSGGRRYTPEAKTQPPHRAQDRAESATSSASISTQYGRNPLIKAASTLLSLGYQISTQRHDPGLAELRDQTIIKIKTFVRDAKKYGADSDTVEKRACYILCGFLDEVIMSTPWGHDLCFNTLSQAFNYDAFAGDNFFKILQDARNDPSTHLDLLEFMYLCMALGFSGKYGVLDGDHVELERLRRDVYEQIMRQRGEIPSELSPHWQGSGEQRQKLSRLIPWWVVASVAASMLVGIYLWFSAKINEIALDAEFKLSHIGQETPVRIGGVFEYSEPREKVKDSIITAASMSIPPKPESSEPDEKAIPVSTILQFITKGTALTAKHREDIDHFVARVKANPELQLIEVEIKGRASHTGPKELNEILAEERAQSVKQYLLDKRIPNLKILSARGLGTSDPLLAATREEQITINQSVEIWVSRKQLKTE